VTKKVSILSISGSLRPGSSTNAVINTVADYFVGKAEFIIYNDTGTLPHFDDNQDPPAEVKEFRRLLKSADGIFICTPEYAFGVPGTLKNALDWTVSTGEFVNKPVALITAATGGENAHRSLLLTLTALSANIPKDSRLLISFIRAKLNEKGEVKDAATLHSIQDVAQALLDNINSLK
jgi:chromate reductase